MRALVTGASGFVGRALVSRLLAAGWKVTALSRRRDPGLPAAARIVTGDLTADAGLPPAVCEGVDVIFHCAGELKDASMMRRVHVEGTRRLLAQVPRGAGMPRWVQLSSVGAYGPPRIPSETRIVDEMTAENAAGEYETTKTESDHLVRRFADEHGMSYAILRPSNVIGAGMSNASLRGVVSAIDRGRFFYIGRAGAMANYVHVDDVTEALMACGTRRESCSETFNLSSDCSWIELVEHVARVRGVRPPRLRLPERAVRLGVAAAGAVWPGRLPLTSSRISALVGRTRYSTRKIEAVLGFRLTRPMPAAVDDIVAIGP